MTSQIQSRLLTGWAVGEGNVVVSNLVPEMDLFFLEQYAGRDGVDWCVAPSLIEETAIPVERLEVVKVLFGPQPVQASDFKVGPLPVR